MMARFTPHRIRFGRPPAGEEDDDGEGLPTPKLLKLKARRMAGIAEAKDVLSVIPAPNESLHALVTHRVDLTDILTALLDKLGRCDRMLIATLGYGERNRRQLLDWLDSGAVGELTLLSSIFFRAHNGDLWERTVEEFRARKQRCACMHSHAKVVTMAMASGERFAVEGSANLRGSGSAREQVAVIHDPGLHDWHARWIAETVSKHEPGDEGTG
jgi:hypothetical protein